MRTHGGAASGARAPGRASKRCAIQDLEAARPEAVKHAGLDELRDRAGEALGRHAERTRKLTGAYGKLDERGAARRL